MRCWRGFLSAVRCQWNAYGSADATPSSLASAKSRMVYPSGTGLPRLSWKKAVKHLCACAYYSPFWFKWLVFHFAIILGTSQVIQSYHLCHCKSVIAICAKTSSNQCWQSRSLKNEHQQEQEVKVIWQKAPSSLQSQTRSTTSFHDDTSI